jgi:hypothetical protein
VVETDIDYVDNFFLTEKIDYQTFDKFFINIYNFPFHRDNFLAVLILLHFHNTI